MSALDDLAGALLAPDAPAPADIVAASDDERRARLDVYRNNVTTTLAGALADTFPVVRQLVGEAFFRAAAVRHLRRQPPTSPLLWRHGAGFADFLATDRAAAVLPYLADVARLEWLRLQAWHAEDAPPLPAAALAAALADPARLPQLRLALQPCVQLLRAAHPAVSIWRAHQADAVSDGFPTEGAEAALVTRDEADALVIPLPHAAAAFVAGLQAGQTLGAALAAASAPMPDGLPLDLGATLAVLIHHGALRAPDCNEETP